MSTLGLLVQTTEDTYLIPHMQSDEKAEVATSLQYVATNKVKAIVDDALRSPAEVLGLCSPTVEGIIKRQEQQCKERDIVLLLQ